MGISVDIGSFKRAQEKLTHSQNALKRNLLNELRKMAAEMQKYARAMTPRETGSLESSIFAHVVNSKNEVHVNLYVSENKMRSGIGNNKRPVRRVPVGVYAGYMNSSQYRLGVKSRLKQVENYGSGMKVKVGKDYIERAGNTVWKRRRDDLKDAGIRAGFGRGRWK
ncbi:HK97 gp10 family phage protein [Xenorhabdus sp. PR6a]|uniref:HK97 gp10 family phage protein n=1 Tax=Xenorhabdus sp. PR6a TaxID=3025877 RepID=UPI002358BB86|nr:HK97 gp10 family phage protein [Xenorhabdus sp. PR6a]MDC9582348.1 HK97 gp10 family phage protein [Xenorhabdus sp. PR6a]